MANRAFAACSGCATALGVSKQDGQRGVCFPRAPKNDAVRRSSTLPESIAATPAANSSEDQHVGPHLQRIELVKFPVTALHRSSCLRDIPGQHSRFKQFGPARPLHRVLDICRQGSVDRFGSLLIIVLGRVNQLISPGRCGWVCTSITRG
jgi:hypothetical protein